MPIQFYNEPAPNLIRPIVIPASPTSLTSTTSPTSPSFTTSPRCDLFEPMPSSPRSILSIPSWTKINSKLLEKITSPWYSTDFTRTPSPLKYIGQATSDSNTPSNFRVIDKFSEKKYPQLPPSPQSGSDSDFSEHDKIYLMTVYSRANNIRDTNIWISEILPKYFKDEHSKRRANDVRDVLELYMYRPTTAGTIIRYIQGMKDSLHSSHMKKKVETWVIDVLRTMQDKSLIFMA